MSTPQATRPAVSGGKPAYMMKADCQRCGRIDFPLLLVTGSVVDVKHGQALKDAGYAYQPGFDADFGNLPRQATLPVIRLLPTGFVHVFYESRGVWDVWQSFADGTYKKLLEHVTPQEYAGKHGVVHVEDGGSVCQRGAANLPAGLITLVGASNQPAIWLAYAPHKWTPEVLSDFHTDGHGKRAETMTLVRAQPWIAGTGSAGRGVLPLNEEGLRHNVVEFNDTPIPPGGERHHPLTTVFAEAVVPLSAARFGQAEAMVERVRAIEKTEGEKAEGKALIAYLRNDVGVADEHAALVAGVHAAYTEWTALGPKRNGQHDPDWAWKHQSTLHVRYVQAWAKAVARHQVKHQARQWLNGPQNGAVPRSTFERDQARGLYPPGTEWQPLTRMHNGKAVPHPQGLGRVAYPETHVQQASRAMGADEVTGRAERYLGSVKLDELEAFEKSHSIQNRQWQDHLASLETDRVAWLEGRPFETCMRYQFDEHKAFCGQKRAPREIRLQVQEALDRLAATDRAYGMPALTPIMLKHVVRMVGKDEKDPTHWIAKALITEFDLIEKIVGDEPDRGLRADLYDGAFRSRDGWKDFREGWELVREGAAQFSANLLNASQQATATMMVAALDAEKAKRWGLSVTLNDATRKQVIWVRAMALQEFLATDVRHYFVGVKWKAGAFLDASIDALRSPMFELKFDHHAAHAQQSRARASASAQAQLRKVQKLAGMDKDITVPLLMDEATLRKAAGRRTGTMLPVVGPNLVGLPQELRELPEEFARGVLKEQAMFRQGWTKRFAEGLGTHRLPAGASAAVILMQGHALQAAIDDFNKKGGAEQVDAAAAMVSAGLGIFGAGVEVGHLLSMPATMATPQAAQLASKVPRYITLRLAAGVLAAMGMGLDAVSAFAKLYARGQRGDWDSMAANAAAFSLYAAGTVGTTYGTYLSFRSAQLLRVATQSVVRIAVAPAMTALGLAGLGMTLVGVGMMLWVGGVSIGVVATMLEDDECEIFLKRSYFGKGGIDQAPKFPDLDKEMLALGTLARGIKVELEWNDEMLGSDEVKATITCMEWDAKARGLSFKVEGFETVNGKLIATLADGNAVLPERPDRGDMYKVSMDYAIRDRAIGAVKFSFTLLDVTHAAAFEKPERRWSETNATLKLAQDFVWITD